jgi:ribonuclease HI
VITMYIDGGSRGNPGPAGYGVRVEDGSGAVLDRFCQSVGVATNNVAEYKGLLAALEWAASRGHPNVLVRSDSELLVRQMKGEYRVRNPGLQPLFAEAQALVRRIGHVVFEHVRRELNRDADSLANEAMDAAAAETLKAD